MRTGGRLDHGGRGGSMIFYEFERDVYFCDSFLSNTPFILRHLAIRVDSYIGDYTRLHYFFVSQHSVTNIKT